MIYHFLRVYVYSSINEDDDLVNYTLHVYYRYMLTVILYIPALYKQKGSFVVSFKTKRESMLPPKLRNLSVELSR